MTGPGAVWLDAFMRVAVAVSPPLLADLLRRLIDRAGMEVATPDTASVDVALLLGRDADGLDAAVTITLDHSAKRAIITDRRGRRSAAPVGGPADIVDLVRSVGGA